MFAKTKIALTAVLVLGSASGAFAFNNIGEIESPAPAMHRHMNGHALAAFASASRRAPNSVAMQNVWIDRTNLYISAN